jgi:hypothetical protein
MACKDKEKFRTSEAASKAALRSKGAIDQFLNIVDTNVFRKLNKKWSTDAKTRFGLDGKLFLEENNKAIPNTSVFQQIDKAKGVHYPGMLESRHNVGVGDTIENNEQPTQPLGDNYAEFVKYKQTQLKDVLKNTSILKNKIKTEDTPNNRSKLRELQKVEQQLENQLEMLAKEQVNFMFHAIIDDLDKIRNTLNNPNLYDAVSIKDQLDFLNDFTSTLIPYEHEDFDKITSEVTKLKALQKEANIATMKQFLENDTLVQELLVNLNKDTKLRENVDTRTNSERGADEPAREITVEDLLIANADISTISKKFFGAITDDTGNTILPQFLLASFTKALNKTQAKAFDMIDEMEEIEKRTGIKNPDWLIEKDSNGEDTEFVSDVYSSSWYAELKNKGKLVSNFYTSLRNGSFTVGDRYKDVVNWLKDKSDIIDFTKLSVVKDIYGNHPEYSKEFIATDEEIKEYEKELKRKLGPRYEETIERVLNKLEKFEETKALAKENFGAFAEKNIASKNIWVFNSEYKKGTPSQIEYTYNNNQNSSSTYFTAFEDLAFIPKENLTNVINTDAGVTVNKTSSNFYNEDFKEVLKDPNKVEYWESVKKMSNYLDTVYHRDNNGRIVYPKVLKTDVENTISNFHALKKSPKLYHKILMKGGHSLLHGWKEMYFVKGSKKDSSSKVKSNYSDASTKQIIDKTQTYILQGYPAETAKEKATAEVLKHYSKDTSRNFKAAILEAALHESRLEVEPLAKAVMQRFKQVKNSNGEVEKRKNAEEKFQYYIEKTILNNSFSPKENTFFDKKLGKSVLRTDIEKELVKEWESMLAKGAPMGEVNIKDGDTVLSKKTREESNPITSPEEDPYFTYGINGREATSEEFDKAYAQYFIDKVAKTGVNFTPAGFVAGVTRTLYAKAMSFAVNSGIFNRIEGKHAALVMDTLGKYWTKGNIHTANNFLALANITRLSNYLIPFRGRKHKEQLQIFESFVKRLGALQDKKSELEKNENSTIGKFQAFITSWSVDNPEFKNQGAVMHAVMQDHVITDNKGNTYPLFDKKTMTFPAFEMVNGILSIKPDFKMVDGVGFAFDSESTGNLTLRLETTVSHSQGNYNALDAMELQSHVAGKAVSVFLRWLPEAINSRFGTKGMNTKGEINASLLTGQQKVEGRYITAFKASPHSFAMFAGTALAIPFGLIFGVYGIAGGLVASTAYAIYLNKVHSKEELRSAKKIVTELAQFTRSVLIETLNYQKVLTYRKGGQGLFEVNNNTSYENVKYLSQEDVGALQSLTRELGIAINLLIISLAVEALRYSLKDDEDESEEAQFLNYIINQLNKVSNSLLVFTNPVAFVTDNSTLPVVREMGNVLELLNPPIGEDTDKWLKWVKKIPVPIPSVFLKEGLPWEDNSIYAEKETTFKGLPNPYNWGAVYTKDIMTGGESTAEKTYDTIRENAREDFEDYYKDQGLKGDELKSAIAIRMNKEFPRREKDESAKSILKRVESGEKGSVKKLKKSKDTSDSLE